MIDRLRSTLRVFRTLLRGHFGSEADSNSASLELASDRGISYALGFLLVFSVVIAGTLALFAVGVETLATADRDEALASNQENLDVIHSEVADMTAQGASRRTLDLELVDATLGVSTDTELTLRVESDSGAFQPMEYETRVLRYHLQGRDSTLYFAFGHGYRSDGERNATGISELPPLFDTIGSGTQLVVPILTGPDPDGPAEIGVSDTGERRVELVSSNSTSVTRTHTRNDSIEPMTGTVSIAGVGHSAVWEDALERRGFEGVQTRQIDGLTTVSGHFTSRTLSVRTATISLNLGGAS